MRIISISNNKGGVGKTTSAVNISAGLQLQEKQVLLIDIDPQAQSTYHFGIKSKELKHTIFDVLKGDISYEDALIDRHGLHILPASLELRGFEFLPIPAKELALKDALQNLQGYDFVLIDCPPSLGTLTLNSLAYANEIFIPLQLQFLPFHGMYNLFEAVEMVKKRLNKSIKITGIIGTMYNARKLINKEVIDEIHKRFPEKMFDTIIRENVTLQEAPSWGQTIFEYKPDSNGAIDYMDLTREILKRDSRTN